MFKDVGSAKITVVGWETVEQVVILLSGRLRKWMVGTRRTGHAGELVEAIRTLFLMYKRTTVTRTTAPRGATHPSVMVRVP
jgi:hypothetical protein